MSTESQAGDRIVLLVSLVMSGVALSALTAFPQRYVEIEVFGSPLGVALSGRWLLAGLLVALTAAGMDDLIRRTSGRRAANVRYTATFWVLPVLVTLAAVVAVPGQFGDVGAWLASLLLLGALLAVVVVAEWGTVRLGSPFYRSARLGLNVATYGAAFALYTTLYGLQVRSLLSASAVALVSFPLALELLRGTEEQLDVTWLYAAVIALVCAEVTWVLNALGLSALGGGLTILLVFYTFSGITQQHLAGRMTRRVVLEFAATAALGLLLVWLSAPGGG